MYNETAQHIIECLLNKRIIVEVHDTPISSFVEYSATVEKNKIVGVRAKKFSFQKNPRLDSSIKNFFDGEARELIDNYGTDLFVLLHEVGHIKTAKGLSITNSKRIKEKVSKISDEKEACIAYRNVPSERRADKWALNWLAKHPKQAKEFKKMLESAVR